MLAASLILPELRMFNAILNPASLSPSKFSEGTLQSLKNTWTVEEPFMPNFFSSSPRVIPPKAFSTIKAERFLSFWFKKNSKFTTLPIIFKDISELN